MLRSPAVVAAVALSILLAACGGPAAPGRDAPGDAAEAAMDGPGYAVADRGLRLSTNAAAPSAAYVALYGDGRAVTLIGAMSPDAERIELHESVREDGIMTMRAVPSVDLGAGEAAEIIMRPGGLHFMVFGVSDAARAAGRVRLELQFAEAPSHEIAVTTATLANAGPIGVPANPEDHSGH